MSDLLERIRVDAHARIDADAAEAERSRKKAEMWLDDLNRNTLARMHLYALESEERAKALHKLYHQQTYGEDFDPVEALRRTHAYFGHLLILCGHDRELLMREHGLSLDRIVPIRSDKFKWSPRLTYADGHMTVRYDWAKRGSFMVTVTMESDDETPRTWAVDG